MATKLGRSDALFPRDCAKIQQSFQAAFWCAYFVAIFKAIHVEGRMLSEMLVGEIINSTQSALQLAGRNAAIGGLRGGIDGAISGAIGNIVLTAADESTWRKSIWQVLMTFGASMLQGAAMGGLAGGVMAGGMAAKEFSTVNENVGKLVEFSEQARIDLDDIGRLQYERRRIVYDLSEHIASGDKSKIAKTVAEIETELGMDPATRIQKHLFVANGKEVERPLIDAYMEQFIRLRGKTFDIEQQQWVELEGFLHGDPASMQTLIARSDEELMYALRSAKEETLDGAHWLSRHGPDVTDAKLERRVTGGYTPDGRLSPQANSTRFSSYQEFWETRELALQQISAGKSNHGVAVDLRFGPGVHHNPLESNYKILIDHTNRPNMAKGVEAVGPSHAKSFPHPSGHGTTSRNVWSSTTPTTHPIIRTQTTLEWIPKPSGGGRWSVVQHFPFGRNLDPISGHYTTPANVTLH